LQTGVPAKRLQNDDKKVRLAAIPFDEANNGKKGRRFHPKIKGVKHDKPAKCPCEFGSRLLH
jgi:hypothetical protein